MRAKPLAMTLALGLLLASAVVAVPSADACPQPPKSCNTFIQETVNSAVQVHVVHADELDDLTPYRDDNGVLHTFVAE